MIKVIPQPEPVDFYVKVQKRGEKFIASTPRPTKEQWQAHAYWREVADELHRAYHGICAYYCQYIPPVTGSDTVDHFKPKSLYPQLAYHWSNFRLMCGLMNGRKGNREDVLDPFQVEDGWFLIDFNTYLISPNSSLDNITYSQVRITIEVLGLNDTRCVSGRIEVLKHFAQYKSMEYLENYAPLIATEIKRQDMIDEIIGRFALSIAQT